MYTALYFIETSPNELFKSIEWSSCHLISEKFDGRAGLIFFTIHFLPIDFTGRADQAFKYIFIYRFNVS